MSINRAGAQRSVWMWLNPLLVATVSTAALHLVIVRYRELNQDILPSGYLIQDWPSNWLMQTLGLEDLLPFGPLAFWYSHVYPPLQDMIRYAFTLPETSAGGSFSAEAVDLRLYGLYAMCFGLVNAILYVWVRSLTRSAWWALGVTIVWALHPGYLTVMTLLDPSPLAMLFVSATLLFLYLFLRYRHLAFATSFFASLVMASLARTVTQSHVLMVVVISLFAFWFMARKRSWWLMLLNVLLVGTLFIIPIKMQILYATSDVTTNAGYHRSGMLWIDPRTVPPRIPESAMEQFRTFEAARLAANDPAQLAGLAPDDIREVQDDYRIARQLWEQQSAPFAEVDFTTVQTYPDRIEQNALRFSSRFNTREQVLDSYRLSAAANSFLIQNPLESAERLTRSLAITIPEAFRPASEYTYNYLVAEIPWRFAWDWLFSSWRYVLLISASAVIIVWSLGWQQTRRLFVRYGWFAVYYGLLALPIMFSNRFRPGEEDDGPIWTDAIRQKVFLEIPVWALGGYALWLIASKAGRTVRRRRRSPTSIGASDAS